jgi:rare lipoprotein A (peptidoglycan hydrolase)
MKKLFIASILLLSFTFKEQGIVGHATYYNTKPHPKVHRHHSTAAYYKGARGKFFLVTNLKNGLSDTVEITDCNGNHKGFIDLKEETFHKLTGNLRIGKIQVRITEI